MTLFVFFRWKGVLRKYRCKKGDISNRIHCYLRDKITLY